ncbi:MAG: hypothetical protein R3F31_24830 [Verrucomicrobiales bacterium]
MEFSLNHPLWRNFRRAGFSTEAPRNYYTRWSQEPTALYVAGGSSGECLLDQAELIAHGEGRAFPHFEPDQVKRRASSRTSRTDTDRPGIHPVWCRQRKRVVRAVVETL